MLLHEAEGLVAKRLGSFRPAERSEDWRKIKPAGMAGGPGVAQLITRACVVLGLAIAHTLPAFTQPIQRSQSEVRAFRSENPCPATGRRSGPCKGWAVDHIRPLCAGGEDKPRNMQWIEDTDHRFKTLVDMRECRKMKRMAGTPAREN